MTVATLVSSDSWVSAGTLAPRSIPFPFIDLDDLRATYTPVSGAVQALVRGTHYTITGNNRAGTAVFTPLVTFAAGGTFRTERVTRALQEYETERSTPLDADSVERELDRQTMRNQEQDRRAADIETRAPLALPGQSAPAFDVTGLAEDDLLVYRGGKLQRYDLAPFAGKFFAGGVGGKFVPSTGLGGGDLALRSDLVQRTGSQLVAFASFGADAVIRDLEDKVRELGVSIIDYGGIPNVDTDAAGLANKAALAKAFAVSKIVHLPGDASTFYAFAASPIVPAACTMKGEGAFGAWVRCRGEGVQLNNFSNFIGLRLEGINPAVEVGTKGSGVVARTSPTPDSLQYTLLTANAKVGCNIYVPHMRNGLLNGMQLNNGSLHNVLIDKAENFGSDAVFSPTEGAIIYAPVLTDSTIVIRDGAQTYGLGAVMGVGWARMKFDLVIHDTRRAALHHPGGGGLPVTGPGNEVRIKAYRLGGLAPDIEDPPANHNQTGCGVFWVGAPRPEYVKIINPVIIDVAENFFEGTMEIVNPFCQITQTGGVNWDDDKFPPNPGACYGNQKVIGGTFNNCRGWILHAGGEAGVGMFDILYDAPVISNPRAAIINGVLTAPKYVHLQPVGSGNVADNVVVRGVVGYDSAGVVTVPFYMQGTGGGSFNSTCQAVNNRATTGTPQIAASVQQIGNSWNTLNARSTPHYMGIDSEEAGGGFKRSFWGYCIDYSTALGSWRLDDFGTERTLFVHGSNSIQMFVIPRTVPAGALSDNDLQQYLVLTMNKAGPGVREVTTATRPTDGTFPGLILFDSTIDSLIVRNAANNGWRVVTTT